MLGAEAVRIECRLPKGGATYQPGSRWPSMLKAAAMEADLIVDMAVGYAEFIIEAINKGTRVMCPGDGIGGPFMDDVLIRTMLPPAQPGILVPMGLGNGTVNVDGTLLYHPDYHEKPDSPIRLTFKSGRLVNIDGDRILAARLQTWLEELDDDGAYNGPVHLNIGNNPNALLTQSQEWERVYGSITCSMGDLSMLSKIEGKSKGANMALSKSSVHWDWTILQPKILLDDMVFAKNGKIYCD